MKKSKWLALMGVALLSVGVLAACSSKSSTSRTTLWLWLLLLKSLDLHHFKYRIPTKTAVTNELNR